MPLSAEALPLDIGPMADNPAIVITDDVSRYSLRKVRILNGAHTALVAKAGPLGFKTVREAVEDPLVGAWLQQVLDNEIVPTVEGRVDDAKGFAADTLVRFKNPFVEHLLESIALHHEDKVKLRLMPTVEEYTKANGAPPPLLSALLN
jgi:tagaturonate reductase